MQFWDFVLIAVSLLFFRPMVWLVHKEPSATNSPEGRAVDLISADPEVIGGSGRMVDYKLNRNDVISVLIVISLAASAPPLRWIGITSLPEGQEIIHGFISFLVLILTWQFATRDYDVTNPIRPQKYVRIILCTTAIFATLVPLFIFAWLYVALRFMDVWKHHIKMPVRLIKMYIVAFSSLSLLLWLEAVFCIDIEITVTPIFILIACVQLSHYLVPGRDKILLGKRWSSWIIQNQTHLLTASAYNWGWANFVDRSKYQDFITKLAPAVIIINIFTIIAESVVALSLYDYKFYIISTVVFIILNTGIFLLSGILFWEYIAVNMGFIAMVAILESHGSGIDFGLPALLASLVVLSAPVIWGRIWSVSKLAWWDTPFVARVRWEVQGVSGRTYGLYNDFMCPFERDYGRNYGNFLVRERILTGHLGIVWTSEVRDAILASNGSVKSIDALKARYGVSFYDAERAAQHADFLRDMFTRLNSGQNKSVLHRWLSWAKAPGGQLYYWGEKPGYKGQEPVASVKAFYTEKYFNQDDRTTSTLRDDLVLDVAIQNTKPDLSK